MQGVLKSLLGLVLLSLFMLYPSARSKSGGRRIYYSRGTLNQIMTVAHRGVCYGYEID